MLKLNVGIINLLVIHKQNSYLGNVLLAFHNLWVNARNMEFRECISDNSGFKTGNSTINFAA